MAGSDIITLSSADVLCEYVAVPEVTKFLAQRMGIGPDLAAILIRDGQVASAAAGAHIAVGGFWQRFKDRIGGSHALRLLIADLKPFAAGGTFSALTRNAVPVTGGVRLELQVNPEAPGNILAFASDTEVVLKSQVYDRLAPYLDERILKAAVREADALALSGDPALQDRIQGAVMREAERVLGDMGLLVNAATVSFALNADEAAAIDKRAGERAAEAYEAKQANLAREIETSAEVTTLKVTSDFDLDKLRAMNDGELAAISRAQEIAAIDEPARAARARHIADVEAQLAAGRLQQEEALRLRLATATSTLDVSRIEVQIDEIRGEADATRRRREAALAKLERLERLEADRAESEFQLDRVGKLNRLNFDPQQWQADLADTQADRATDRQIRADDAVHGRGRETARDAHAFQMEQRTAQAEAELAQLKARGDMSVDHVLAINAGMSPDNAAIFAERARAEARDDAAKLALMREMLDRQRADAAGFAALQKDAAVGVAQGYGGGGAAKVVICPQCREENAATAKFCKECGTPLRPA